MHVDKHDPPPYCTGEYEAGDTNCDGDPEGKTDFQRNACAYRDGCVAFQAHLAETKLKADDFIEAVPDEDDRTGQRVLGRPKRGTKTFLKLLEKQIKRFGVVDGEVTRDPNAPKKPKRAPENDGRKNLRPSKEAQELARKAITQRAIERREDLKRLFDWFKTHMVENLEVYRFTAPGEIVKPGRFYIVDRMKTSNYVSVYCKKPYGKDAPVAVIKFKTRSMTFDIEIPVEVTGYIGVGKVTMDKLKPQPIDDGKFRSVMPHLDKEGVALAAQTIAHLVKRGKIDLPPAR
jgi:hypothetical protein